MRKNAIAALLSGLVLPGLGQIMVLRRKGRGLAFMLPALAAVVWLLMGLLPVLAGLGEMASAGADPFALAERLSAQGAPPGAEFASLVLLVCWLGSVLDALLTRDGA